MFKSLEKLPSTVIVLGFVSLLNDLASEMVTPLIPVVLVAVLGAGPVVLGLVEGVAETLASFLKLWSGRWSDRSGRRKTLTFAGYLLSNLVRPFLGLAGNWPEVVGLRAADRVGKGLRTAPRDALVADSTPPSIRGLAFGYHRAMDNGGAMGGSLLAAAVLAWTPLDLGQVILVSAIPGLMVVLLVLLGVREPMPAAPRPEERAPLRLQWSDLSVPMRRYLSVLALFAFARASETFIMLRGSELGIGVVELLLIWSALSFSKSVSSWLGGGWADRLGHVRLVFFGWIAHGVAFTGLASVSSGAGLWAAAIGYGLLTGAAEGAERALVGDMAGPRERGTAFGWYNMILGFSAIPAGLLFGSVWQGFGARASFGMAAAIAFTAVLLFHLFSMSAARAGADKVP